MKLDVTRMDSLAPMPSWVQAALKAENERACREAIERHAGRERYIIAGALLMALFSAGWLSYYRANHDPFQYIRDACLSHHGTPVDDLDADGRVLAIRCDLVRSLP